MSRAEKLHCEKAPLFPSAPAPRSGAAGSLPRAAAGTGRVTAPREIRVAPRSRTQLPGRATPRRGSRGGRAPSGRRGTGARELPVLRVPTRDAPGAAAAPSRPRAAPRTRRAGVTRGGCGCWKLLINSGDLPQSLTPPPAPAALRGSPGSRPPGRKHPPRRRPPSGPGGLCRGRRWGAGAAVPDTPRARRCLSGGGGAVGREPGQAQGRRRRARPCKPQKPDTAPPAPRGDPFVRRGGRVSPVGGCKLSPAARRLPARPRGVTGFRNYGGGRAGALRS